MFVTDFAALNWRAPTEPVPLIPYHYWLRSIGICYHAVNMTEHSHDRLVIRLVQMLVKLNQGEKLDPGALAAEFGVNLRTIQRDLNERFAYLPLVKADGLYQLEPIFLGKLNTRDIERFASLAGVSGLFPSLSNGFLRDIFDARIQSALLVKGHHYEDISGKLPQFRALEKAIVGHHLIAFTYAKDEGTKRYTDVEPYKLVNHKGIWYLAGRDGGKLKTFSFMKISGLEASQASFMPDTAVNVALEPFHYTHLGRPAAGHKLR